MGGTLYSVQYCKFIKNVCYPIVFILRLLHKYFAQEPMTENKFDKIFVFVVVVKDRTVVFL